MLSDVINISEAEQLKSLINDARNVAITCHVSPDGDAIGSTLALWHVLTAMGKNASVITPDQSPKSLSFLAGVDRIIAATCNPEAARRKFAKADLIFCLDFNSLSRVDRMADLLKKTSGKKVLIDHHLDPETFADLTISQPKMSSACLLLYRVLTQLGYDKYIDKNAAECIYTGMMTDTGNFTYNSSDPDIYIVIAQLIKKGIDKDAIYTIVCNTKNESCLRINGYALSQKMQLYPQHHAALIVLSREEMSNYNFQKGDTEGLVNMPLSIPGIIYSAFIRDDNDVTGRINVSMRSKGDFPVNKVCEAHYNGGGHKNAAGGEYYGNIAEAKQLFESLLTENDKYINNETC